MANRVIKINEIREGGKFKEFGFSNKDIDTLIKKFSEDSNSLSVSLRHLLINSGILAEVMCLENKSNDFVYKNFKKKLISCDCHSCVFLGEYIMDILMCDSIISVNDYLNIVTKSNSNLRLRYDLVWFNKAGYGYKLGDIRSLRNYRFGRE